MDSWGPQNMFVSTWLHDFLGPFGLKLSVIPQIEL